MKGSPIGTREPVAISTRGKAEARYLPGAILEIVWEGNVRVKQGDVSMTCDRLVALCDDKGGGPSSEKRPTKPANAALAVVREDDIRSITAAGNVKIVQNERMATAGKAEFDRAKRTITLTEGPPKLWHGENALEADRIVIHLDEDRTELTSDGGKQIRATLRPHNLEKTK